ncbi:acyltransferase family protein [Pontibacter sp. Tf4]|uniref:acyltransferase n=1 Tax=Pontibacter sp. Tf4 TaxID=2761620 RepID=UPI0016257572|nr:acyltransferase family protein [Pontibacter sp. Tf4]MBB6610283.1 acyltransferase family protein [Pontibacter sp. Tf4]
MQPVLGTTIDANTAATKRVAAFDLIRVFAAFSVIVVHVATPVVRSNAPDTLLWWSGNVYEALFRSGVPLFLMLSGALLLPKATGLTFIKNRVLRVFFPFAFWTLVFIVARHKLADITFADYSIGLLKGATGYFWYVYLIIGIYSCMPLLRIILQKSGLTASGAILLICLTSIGWYGVQLLAPAAETVLRYIIYVEYVVLGYLLTTVKEHDWLGKRTVSLLFIVIGFIGTLAGAYCYAVTVGTEGELFYESVGLQIIFRSIGIWFIAFRVIRYFSASVIKVITRLSKFTFAVFLMHPLVIDHILVARMGISLNFEVPVIGIPIAAVLCFCMASAMAYLLGKLPLGKFTY